MASSEKVSCDPFQEKIVFAQKDFWKIASLNPFDSPLFKNKP